MAAGMVVGTPVKLAGSIATLETVTAGKTAIIKEIVLCNTDTSDRTVTINFVPSGGAAGVENQVYADVVRSKETLIIGLNTMLEAGALIRGYASAANVVGCRISRVEV